MNNVFISVIVPIYNVEPYLRTCIDSIINQTYSNLEIVLVDDGSPDACPQICDEYKIKDCRIKVIHQNNRGLAHARNVGIANACGEYITFVDSDDIIALNYVEYLYQGIYDYNAEISVATFQTFEKEITSSSSNILNNKFDEISKKEAISRYTSINADVSMPFISACNKLYKAKLFDGISFPEGKLYEDAFTTYKILDRAKKIVFSSTRLYFYRINPKSILGQTFREKHIEMVEAFRNGMEYFNDKTEKDIAEMFRVPLLMREIYCWWGVNNILKNKDLSRKLLDDYRNDCKKNESMKTFHYFVFKIFALFPFLYTLYRLLSPRYIGDRK